MLVETEHCEVALITWQMGLRSKQERVRPIFDQMTTELPAHSQDILQGGWKTEKVNDQDGSDLVRKLTLQIFEVERQVLLDVVETHFPSRPQCRLDSCAMESRQQDRIASGTRHCAQELIQGGTAIVSVVERSPSTCKSAPFWPRRTEILPAQRRMRTQIHQFKISARSCAKSAARAVREYFFTASREVTGEAPSRRSPRNRLSPSAIFSHESSGTMQPTPSARSAAAVSPSSCTKANIGRRARKYS